MGEVFRDWSLPGAEDEPILVTSHCAAPPDQLRGVAILAHGFKGYKDYGFLPVLAHRLALALPVVVHRFNFSHSGMTNNIETFERPELFQFDTWNKQVFDLNCLIDAVASGQAELTPPNLPYALLGHSRGGTTCLLTAGRRSRERREPQPAAIVTMASPDSTCSFDSATIKRMRTQGYLITPSTRTRQSLRQDRIWLDEQVAQPADHRVLDLTRKIKCPVLVIQGEADVTVTPASARHIAGACDDAEQVLIPDANHVFNTSNPADPDAEPSPPLAILIERVIAHLRRTLDM